MIYVKCSDNKLVQHVGSFVSAKLLITKTFFVRTMKDMLDITYSNIRLSCYSKEIGVPKNENISCLPKIWNHIYVALKMRYQNCFKIVVKNLKKKVHRKLQCCLERSMI